MAGKVEIKIDIESESVEFVTDRTLTLTEKIKLLRRELQTIPEGTKDWHIVNNTFNDTTDALDRVNTKSKDIFGTMSLLPGPIGQVSSSLESSIDAFKIFSSLKVTDIKAQLNNLLDDFKGIAKTLGNLTGITKLYTTMNNALASSFVKVGVGEQAAAAGAKAFSAALIATGVGALVVALGFAVSALMDFASGADEAAAAEKDLNDQLERTNTLLDMDLADARRRQAKRIAELRSQGVDEKTIRDQELKDLQENAVIKKNALNDFYAAEDKAMKDGASNLEEAQAATRKAEEAYADAVNAIEVKKLNNITDANKETQAVRDKANQKSEQQREKDKANREKELEELKKGNEEALKETKTARENEINEINAKYTRLINLAEKYGQDTSMLRKGQVEALAKAVKKYDEEDLENLTKAGEERLKLIEKYLDKENILRENKRNEAAKKASAQLEKDLYAGLITEEEFEQKSLQLNLQTAQQKEKDDDDAYKKQKASLLVARMFGQITQQQFEEQSIEAQKNYDQQKIDNQNAVTDAGLAIEAKNYDRRKEIEQATTEALAAEKEAQIGLQFAYLDAVGAAAGILKMFAGENKNLQKAAIVLSQGAAIGKILVDSSASIASQTAAGLRNGIILGGPFLNPVGFAANAAATAKGILMTKIGAGIGIAGAIAGAVKGIAEIDKAGQESSKSAAESAKPTGSKFAKGGLLVGPSHSQGGIKSAYGELEGGEFVINKRSTRSFMPLLSAINSAGNRKYANGGMTPSMSDLQEMMAQQSSPVIKTYVVASELRSEEEANHKISQLARI
jgi:hypothetical protein